MYTVESLNVGFMINYLTKKYLGPVVKLRTRKNLQMSTETERMGLLVTFLPSGLSSWPITQPVAIKSLKVSRFRALR